MQNTLSRNQSDYTNGLKKTWAFSQNLTDFTIPIKILILLTRLLTFVLYSVFFLIKAIILFIVGLCKTNKVFKWLVIILLIAGAIGLIDYLAFYGKIYPGVYVGEIDLGGKTVEEAETLINDTYLERLSRNDVVIYANDEAQAAGVQDEGASGIAEELSVEQAKQTVQYWKTDAVELEASLPTADLVDKALNSTRGLLNIFSRIGALLFKQIIEPYADFNDSAIQSQILRVNDTIGKAVVNPTCVIEDGQAQAKEGNDGLLVNNDEFINQINKAFFESNNENSHFVPKLYVAKQQVSFAAAKTLAQKINTSLEKEVSFNYKGNEWKVDKLNLCNWITIEVQDRSDEANAGCSCASMFGPAYCISAMVDSNQAGADILVHTREQNMESNDYSIQMIKDTNSITVKTQGDFEMPAIYDAVDILNEKWLNNAAVYENDLAGASGDNDTDPVNIKIGSTKVPETLSLDEAIRIGVVSEISTYTTTYSSGAGTENRNKNIALGAAALNNTICAANGGTWSFNEVVGNTTEDKGYLEAGAIWGNRYTKSVGGGICQVATTVFNAVYDSGLAIPERYNHDLHIASYPVGRDAAINYPDLDLVWRNDEKSDILLTSSTTGYSITVSLLGVPPAYTVKTEVGEWTPGEHYKQEFVVDPTKEPNSKKVQTSGSDGKSIIIHRFVYNRNGQLVRQDEFKSNYKPKSEIVVLGPGDEANQLLAQHLARMKDETDNW